MVTTNRWRRMLGVILVTAAAGSHATRADETARQILDRGEALDQSARWWSDRYQRLQLTVEEDGTAARHVELESYDRRQHGRHQQSLVVFVSPAEKAGLTLLDHTEGGKAAEQWLYVPAFARARQIAGAARSNKFDITGFTYQDLDVLTDMPHWTEADAQTTLLRTETIDGVSCYVIQLEPRLEHVTYPRILVWLGSEDLVGRQVEFYATAKAPWVGEDRPERRFRQQDIRNVGTIPVAHHIVVETPAEHARTLIDVVTVTFEQGLTDAFFSPGRLGTRS